MRPITYDNIVPVLLQAIKKQQEQIEYPKKMTVSDEI